MTQKIWTADKKLIKDLKDREGYRKNTYTCKNGYLSVGYGRNLDAVGIRENEATMMLLNDVNEVINQLDIKIPWWRETPERVQRVLIDMGFNMGVGKLLKFVKMLSLLQAGHYDFAAQEMLHSKYAKDVGQRAIDNFNHMTGRD